eukprot:Tbor_TRINITY_DN3459_c0_g1::TRINITY_DN3459_c0_g1_i1::g.3690::m.3690
MTAVSAFQRSKESYLREENKLHSITSDTGFQHVFQSWQDATVADLDTLYEGCEHQLAELQQLLAVEEGDYWNSHTIMQHCNLHVGKKRLISKGMNLVTHPSWPDIVRLVSALNSLKTKGFISSHHVKFIEQVEQELKNLVLNPQDLNIITGALETKLRDDSTNVNVTSELSKYQSMVDSLAPDLDTSEQLLESAIMSGDMQLAEDIANRQIDLHEHMLDLIIRQYPVIQEHHSDTLEGMRLRRWAIFRMANRDISHVIHSKHMQIEACEEDLLKIKDQLENYSTDNAFQRKRYLTDCNESDAFLINNKEKQQAVWNRIYDIFQELQKCQSELGDLANMRRREVERRLGLEEREAARRSGHEAFLRAADAHAGLLQDTIDNSVAAKELCSALNEFVLDGCDNVSERYDRQQATYREMMRLVRNHHFKRFTDFYLCAGRMVYRKEQKMKKINEAIVGAKINFEVKTDTLDPVAKKYADNVKELEREKVNLTSELDKLRSRIATANTSISQTLQSFTYQNIKYVHPEEILAKINMDRQTRVLDYREIVNPEVPACETLLREEEMGYASKQRETEYAYEIRRQYMDADRRISESFFTGRRVSPSGVNIPSPPGVDEKTRQQYKRFQLLLDKKLEVPVAPPASGVMDRATGDMLASVSVNSVKDRPLEGASMRALYRYRARAPDEMSFEKGDIIICIGPGAEEGWCRGMCNQRGGLFPINYVTIAQD